MFRMFINSHTCTLSICDGSNARVGYSVFPDGTWLDECTGRLGNPMERKAISQNPSRSFGVPQLSIKRARPTPFSLQCVVDTPGGLSGS